MRETIRRLFGASVFLLICSLSSLYVGSVEATAAPPAPADILSQQFGADPGDGWLLAGGFLLLLAQSMRGGAREGTPGVAFRTATRVRCDGDAAVQADGELIGELPMTFEIAPEGVEVIVN